MDSQRAPYSSYLDDDTYAFMLPYLLLKPEDVPQRVYPIREVLNALLYVGRTGVQWESLPHDFPPYKIVHQQAIRWFEHHCFENMQHDLRIMVRREDFRDGQPTVALVDSRTLQSTPESGSRAGYDGGKKKRGTKIHLAVDTLGSVISVIATAADEQDRDQVFDICQKIQEETGGNIDVMIGDQGYTGEQVEIDAALNHIEFVIIKRSDSAKGFVLLPRRWVIERSFGWFSRFRRLGRDLERLSSTLVGFHYLASAVLLSNKLFPILGRLA